MTIVIPAKLQATGRDLLRLWAHKAPRLLCKKTPWDLQWTWQLMADGSPTLMSVWRTVTLIESVSFLHSTRVTACSRIGNQTPTRRFKAELFIGSNRESHYYCCYYSIVCNQRWCQSTDKCPMGKKNHNSVVRYLMSIRVIGPFFFFFFSNVQNYTLAT